MMKRNIDDETDVRGYLGNRLKVGASKAKALSSDVNRALSRFQTGQQIFPAHLSDAEDIQSDNIEYSPLLRPGVPKSGYGATVTPSSSTRRASRSRSPYNEVL